MTAIWTQVTAVLPEVPEDWARWIQLFEQHKLPGTLQTDDPPTLSAFVPPGDEENLPALRADLEAAGATVEIDQVEEEDWQEAWKAFFKPTRVGERWMIVPTWETYDPKPEDRVLILDPGQAFGTGDHPTTRGCLVLMEKLKVEGKRVADIGCGTGILSFAADMMGAQSVVAVDYDTQSVEVARENASRLGHDIELHVGEFFNPLPKGEQYDLILSNIISQALITMAPQVPSRLAEGGTWLVSGIIKDNWKEVVEAFTVQGLGIQEAYEKGDWVAATFR